MDNIHDRYKLEDKDNILKSYQKSIGRYIFCRARNDGETRLFIDGMDISTNALTKDGWWDVFTVTDRNNPQEKGLYLCKITDYYLDRTGFINCKVKPVLAISEEDLDSGNEFLRLFHMTDYFPEYYHLELAKTIRYNIKVLYNAYDKEYQEYLNTNKISFRPTDVGMKHHHFATMIFNMFLSGGITIPRINELLQTMFPIEVLAKDVQDRYESYYRETYPTFYAEVKRKKVPLWSMQEITYYLEERSDTFSKMVHDGKLEHTDDIIRQVELIREYYLKQNKRKKEEERAARKEKRKQKQTAQ